jgi:hypothetical protein
MLRSAVTRRTQLHLTVAFLPRVRDNVPIGVEYGKLLDIGRNIIEEKVERKRGDRFAAGS